MSRCWECNDQVGGCPFCYKEEEVMKRCDGNHSMKEYCDDVECWIDENRNFNIWWWNEGSGMGPKPAREEEVCDHVERVSRVAWVNGEYKAREDIEPLTNSLGAVMSYLLCQKQSFKDDLLDGKIDEARLAEWGIRATIKGDHIQLLI